MMNFLKRIMYYFRTALPLCTLLKMLEDNKKQKNFTGFKKYNP